MNDPSETPDAVMFALEPEWSTLSAAEDAASRELQRVQRECHEARDPVPRPLLVQAGDEILAWTGVEAVACPYRGAEGERWYGTKEAFIALDVGLIRAKEIDQGDEYDRRLIRRIEGILCDHTLWHSHRVLVERKHGLEAAEKEWAEAETACSGLRRRIALIRPRTLEGILFKSRVAQWCYASGTEEVEGYLRAKILSEVPYGPTAPTMAEVVAFDLHRFTEEADKDPCLIGLGQHPG